MASSDSGTTFSPPIVDDPTGKFKEHGTLNRLAVVCTDRYFAVVLQEDQVVVANAIDDAFRKFFRTRQLIFDCCNWTDVVRNFRQDVEVQVQRFFRKPVPSRMETDQCRTTDTSARF